MIARIHGQLENMLDDRIHVQVSEGITVEVLVSAYTSSRLAPSLGKLVTLHTLTFLESQNQGAMFTPRLAGFLAAQDRAFFEMFVTTKGIGYRRALRALTLPVPQIAQAIQERDIKLLQTLPEVGKKMAENISLALHEKMDRFLDVPQPRDSTADPGEGIELNTSTSLAGEDRQHVRAALDVLTQLGENRAQAALWLDEAARTLREADEPIETQRLIEEAYRLRQSR